jgi:hypothetical protein
MQSIFGSTEVLGATADPELEPYLKRFIGTVI